MYLGCEEVTKLKLWNAYLKKTRSSRHWSAYLGCEESIHLSDSTPKSRWAPDAGQQMTSNAMSVMH